MVLAWSWYNIASMVSLETKEMIISHYRWEDVSTGRDNLLFYFIENTNFSSWDTKQIIYNPPFWLIENKGRTIENHHYLCLNAS